MLWHDFCVNGPVLWETWVLSFMGPVFPLETDISRELRTQKVDFLPENILKTSQDWSLKKRKSFSLTRGQDSAWGGFEVGLPLPCGTWDRRAFADTQIKCLLSEKCVWLCETENTYERKGLGTGSLNWNELFREGKINGFFWWNLSLVVPPGCWDSTTDCVVESSFAKEINLLSHEKYF